MRLPFHDDGDDETTSLLGAMPEPHGCFPFWFLSSTQHHRYHERVPCAEKKWLVGVVFLVLLCSKEAGGVWQQTKLPSFAKSFHSLVDV